MRLSEIPTDKFADALCVVGPAIANIATEKGIEEAVRAIDRKNMHASLVAVARDLIPALFSGHREDVYAIIAALSGKSMADVRAQAISCTIEDIKNLVDGDLVDFFMPAATPDLKK